MDDIRIDERKKQIDNRVKIFNFLNWFKRNWKTLIILGLISMALFFPTFTGNLISEWIKEFVTPFINNLKF